MGADANNSEASGSFRFIILKEIYLRVVGPAKAMCLIFFFYTRSVRNSCRSDKCLVRYGRNSDKPTLLADFDQN